MSANAPTPYERLGGEDGVRRLVDLFYDHMDNLEEARTTRNLHAKSLKGSRRKLFMFLSGWLGGPNLYIEKYGHPRLRARHLPFSIGSQERDEWMLCMRRALDDMGLDETFRAQLEAAFSSTADHMRNRNEGDGRFNILPTGSVGR
ncbi:MAG: group II truncated hemoglobin [Gammaproteobacteria bacterium]